MTAHRQLLSLALSTILAACSAFCEEPTILFKPGVAAPDLDALFQRKDGWIGADGAYSVSLSAEKTLWLFSDTWLGQIRDNKRTRPSMINNSVGVQTGRGADAKIDFVMREAGGGKFASVLTPADGRGFFWLNAAVHAHGRLHIFLAQVEKTADPSAFGFRQIGQKLGIVSNPLDSPTQWRIEELALPFTEFSAARTLTFGGAALLDGEYLYAYGIDEQLKPRNRGKHMILSRVKSDQIANTSAWRFFRDGQWETDFRACTHLAKNFAFEYSVTYMPAFKRYVAVCTQGGMSHKVVARTAPAPWGPWSEPTVIFECPEASDKKAFCYAAKAHPMLAANDREIVVSYVVNAFDLPHVINDARLYWPRFARVQCDLVPNPNP